MICALEHTDRPEWLRMRKLLWPDCPDDMHAIEVAQHDAKAADSAVFVFRRPSNSLGGFVEVSFCARVDGSTSERVGYVEGWFVDEDLRGRGIGKQLIAAAERW